MFRIPSVPACGTARLDFLVSVLASPCPGCPSSFGSAVSPARLRSSLWNQTLRSNSLFPQRVTSFTLDHMKKLKNNPIVGDIGFCGQRDRPSWLRWLGMHDSSTVTHLVLRHRLSQEHAVSIVIGHSVTVPASRQTAQFGLRHSLRPFLMSCFCADKDLHLDDFQSFEYEILDLV